MPMLMVRYQVPVTAAAEVADAVEEAFAGLAAARPEGVRFTYWRYADASEFVALLDLDDGVENPLPAIEATRRLQATVAGRAEGETPAPRPVRLLGSYGG